MIDKHILYPFIEKKINKKYVNFKEKLIEYCKTDKLMNEYYLNIIIHQNRIGYVSGNKKNPLDNIYVYKSKNLSHGEFLPQKINKQTSSIIVPEIYQEHVIMLFYRIYDQEAIKYIAEKMDDILVDMPIDKSNILADAY